MNGARFDYGRLHAYIPMRHSEYLSSHSYFFDPHHILRRPPAEEETKVVLDHLFRIAIVEHEYFHCRSFLSTSFGLFANMTACIAQDMKEYFIEDVATKSDMILSGTSFEKLMAGASIDVADQNATMAYEFWRHTLRLAFHPSARQYVSFRKVQLKLLASGRTRSSRSDRALMMDLDFPSRPYLHNAKRPDGRRRSGSRFTVRDVLEGLAMWREYSYVSLIGITRPHMFKELTDAWVCNTLKFDTYRKVADAILEATGCNLSAAATGAILDIAMNGPWFCSNPVEWTELYPNARLEAMLGAVAEVPESWTKLDNLEILNPQFYTSIATYFEEKLGWRSVGENIKDSIAYVDREIAKIYATIEPRVNDALRRVELLKFQLALRERVKTPSIFLHWAQGDAAQITNAGYLSQPTLTTFNDQLSVSPSLSVLPGRVIYVRLVKELQVLVSQQLIDSTDIPAVDRLSIPREFWTRCRSYMEQNHPLINTMSFDVIMEDWLGAHWRRLCAVHNL